MKCVWREYGKRGYYRCKNCKLPAATTKLFLDRLPPKRNCNNPRSQFLLGDFLERMTSRLPDAFRERWAKRIDRLTGITDDKKSCGCAKRQKALNDWTLELAALPGWRRPFRIVRDLGNVLVKTWPNSFPDPQDRRG